MRRHQGFIFDIFLLFLAFLFGFVSLKNSAILPKCHISKFIHYKNDEPYIVKGIIKNQPVSKDNKTAFIFKTEAIQPGNFNYSCCGNILVKIKAKKDLYYGEGLILRGNLYKPFSKPNSARQSYRDYLYNQDIRFIMSVETEADIVRLNKNQGFVLKRLAFWLKQKTQDSIYRHSSFLTAAVLDAMILGEKKNIPWFVNDAMMKSGTLHILVVSGFNVGIIAFIVFLILKLTRLPRKLRFIAAIPLLILYCLITGASNPVVRATVMAVMFIIAYLIKREPDIYNSLGIAAIFILTANPRQLFDIGFQLSFVSVLSIVCIYPQLKLVLRAEALKIRFLKFLLEGCLVSVSAWLGTMGFIAYYFKIFSPVTVLANIFIVPLAALITLSGISLVVIGLLFPAIAPFFASTTELEVFVLLKINAFLINLPLSYFHLP